MPRAAPFCNRPKPAPEEQRLRSVPACAKFLKPVAVDAGVPLAKPTSCERAFA